MSRPFKLIRRGPAQFDVTEILFYLQDNSPSRPYAFRIEGDGQVQDVDVAITPLQPFRDCCVILGVTADGQGVELIYEPDSTSGEHGVMMDSP